MVSAVMLRLEHLSGQTSPDLNLVHPVITNPSDQFAKASKFLVSNRYGVDREPCLGDFRTLCAHPHPSPCACFFRLLCEIALAAVH